MEFIRKQEVSKEIIENWCIEEQAMGVDISMLQQVEVLEKKIMSARLQVEGWMHPEPQSERDDLVYHEHKFSSSSAPEKKTQRKNSQEELPGALVRQPNNPLDIAVVRLAELERNIERSEDEAAPAVRLLRKALGEVRSSAQLSLCMQQLQKSITWERSVVKVHCQLCQKGDNEDLLLLCDACDKGCHTYCHRPKITIVPDSGWFCPACVVKESGQSPRSRRQQSRTAGGGKKCSELKRNGKPSALGELIQEEAANSKCVPKKSTKEPKKRKGNDSPPITQTRHDSPVSCEKKARLAQDSTTKGLATCRVLLAELEAHQDAWPFLTPVNHKAVPGYRKVIKKPMDFSTIREKLITNQYSNWETFIVDVNLIFENCERFNEDDSEIGRAGHSMRIFFDKRWAELLM
uniref:Bromodomain adjacent to zinc finger domain 2B n=1 Tax=Mola mola TaxID=94237 RepID=A0A3Q3VZS4_MOLML